MSRNINVNPAHYKVAGRERQGEDIIQQQQKQAYATQQADGRSDGVPPWEATRHSFVSAQPPEPAPARKVRKPRAKPRVSQAKRGMSEAKRPAARKTSKKTTRAKNKKTTRASGASARRRTAASRSASRQRSVKRTTRRR
jgi:hypothetical protein